MGPRKTPVIELSFGKENGLHQTLYIGFETNHIFLVTREKNAVEASYTAQMFSYRHFDLIASGPFGFEAKDYSFSKYKKRGAPMKEIQLPDWFPLD